MSDSSVRGRTIAHEARQVAGTINYIAEMAERPRYYANDHSRDVLTLDPRTVPITDARSLMTAPALSIEGAPCFAVSSATDLPATKSD